MTLCALVSNVVGREHLLIPGMMHEQDEDGCFMACEALTNSATSNNNGGWCTKNRFLSSIFWGDIDGEGSSLGRSTEDSVLHFYFFSFFLSFQVLLSFYESSEVQLHRVALLELGVR